MGGTDGISDMLSEGMILARAKGVGGFVSFGAKGAFLEGEFISALDDVQLPDGGTLKPTAFNVELGMCLPNMPVEIAGRYEQVTEDGDNTINRFGGVVSLRLFSETTALAVEFLRTEDGDNAENSIVSQLAVEF
jgi:hypothetical protein